MGISDALNPNRRVETQKPIRDLTTLLIVDPEEPLTRAVRSADRDRLRANILTLVQMAEILDIPRVVTMVSEPATDRLLWPEIAIMTDKLAILPRPTFNPFHSDRLSATLLALSRPRLTIVGLWTEGCVTHAALTGLALGYDVQIVVDCVASVSVDGHHFGLQRLVEAGCVPVSWHQLVFEWQQSWDDVGPPHAVVELLRNHPETDDIYKSYLDGLTA